jgi:hypothetical protein
LLSNWEKKEKLRKEKLLKQIFLSSIWGTRFLPKFVRKEIRKSPSLLNFSVFYQFFSPFQLLNWGKKNFFELYFFSSIEEQSFLQGKDVKFALLFFSFFFLAEIAKLSNLPFFSGKEGAPGPQGKLLMLFRLINLHIQGPPGAAGEKGKDGENGKPGGQGKYKKWDL